MFALLVLVSLAGCRSYRNPEGVGWFIQPEDRLGQVSGSSTVKVVPRKGLPKIEADESLPKLDVGEDRLDVLFVLSRSSLEQLTTTDVDDGLDWLETAILVQLGHSLAGRVHPWRPLQEDDEPEDGAVNFVIAGSVGFATVSKKIARKWQLACEIDALLWLLPGTSPECETALKGGAASLSADSPWHVRLGAETQQSVEGGSGLARYRVTERLKEQAVRSVVKKLIQTKVLRDALVRVLGPAPQVP